MKKFVPNDFNKKTEEELNNLIAENNYGAMYELAIRKAKVNDETSQQESNELFNKVRVECEKINDTNAKAYLGRIYYYGKGINKDYPKALQLFLDCYNDGNKIISGFLGEFYYYGKGVERDYSKAKEYFEESYALGDKYSIGFLGEIYYFGKGTDIDYEKARSFFEESAVKGDNESKYYLGLIYYKGLGIDKNYLLARKYFEECAKVNDSDALYYLGEIYYFGRYVEPDVKKSIDYFERAVENGNFRAAFYLGEIFSDRYNFGFNLKGDYEKALYYYKKGFEAGFEYPALRLGEAYYYGKGVEVDYAKAKEFFEYAPSFNEAKIYLAKMYYFGYGVDKNINLARELFNQVETNPDIQVCLDEVRHATKDDFEEIKEKYEEQVVDDNFSSLIYIYEMYFNGFGTEVDIELANSYIYILVLTMLYSAIFYTLALKTNEEQSLKSTREFLSREKELQDGFINTFPDGHPAKANYERIKELGVYGYEIVREIAYYALNKYIDSGRPDLGECVFNYEEDVEKFIKELLKNYDSFIEIINLDK